MCQVMVQYVTFVASEWWVISHACQARRFSEKYFRNVKYETIR